MNETGDTLDVTCGNNRCGLSSHVIGNADMQDTICRSIRNPKNLQYCPACAKNTLFGCPECHEWHPAHHLLNKPYVCPTEVDQAVGKYNSLLTPYDILVLIPVGIWVVLLLIAALFIQPGTEVGLWRLIHYGVWSLLMIPALWLIGGIWTYFTNKKRKISFQQNFPNEWKLVQRFPDGLD